jgi:hypothetical protein
VLLIAALGIALVQCESGSGSDDAGAGRAGQSGSGNASGAGGGPATGGSSGAPGGGTSGRGTTNGSCDNPTPAPNRAPAPAPVDEATFTAQWPAVVCAAMKPGCDSGTVAYDEAACLAYAATVFDDALAFDAGDAGACLAALRESTYTSVGLLDFRGWPNPCYTVYRGDVAVAGACDSDTDCAPDPRGHVWCDFDTEVCTVLVRGKLGETCHEGCELETDNGSCYPLFEPEEPGVEVTCHNEDGLRCGLSGKCEPSSAVGCPCTLGGDDYCNAQGDCTEGADSVCIPRAAAGSPCTVHASCVAATYCSDGAVCAPRKQAGEACDDHDQCIGSYCQGGACVPNSGVLRGRFDDAYCDGMGT